MWPRRCVISSEDDQRGSHEARPVLEDPRQEVRVAEVLALFGVLERALGPADEHAPGRVAEDGEVVPAGHDDAAPRDAGKLCAAEDPKLHRVDGGQASVESRAAEA